MPGGCEEKRTLIHCLRPFKLVQPLWKSVWSTLKKLQINLPHDPAITLLDMYLKDPTSCFPNTCSNMFFAALFIIATK